MMLLASGHGGTIVWGCVALLAWAWSAWISHGQRVSADKEVHSARELVAAGHWEDATLPYKKAILHMLHDPQALTELTAELTDLYQRNGVTADLRELHGCPRLISSLGSGTRNARKKGELLGRIYADAGRFLDTLHGPAIP